MYRIDREVSSSQVCQVFCSTLQTDLGYVRSNNPKLQKANFEVGERISAQMEYYMTNQMMKEYVTCVEAHFYVLYSVKTFLKKLTDFF